MATQRIVANVRPAQWSAQTPCPEWDVRHVVSHLVSGSLWVHELGLGRTIEEVGSRLDGDLLGEDPLRAYEESAAAAIAAFGAPDAMERLWPLSFGPRPGRVYARQRLIDVLIHGWDIAKATGQDTRLPDHLVASVLSYLQARPQVAAAWGFAAVDVPATAQPQDKMLAMAGRRD